MTTFNQLGEFGLNQLLARRLTTPGPAPSPTLEPALFPCVVLESERPEWAYLKGERLGAGRSAQGAVAAQFSCFAILNPTGSNMVVTVKRTAITTGASSALVKITAQQLAGAPVTAAPRDSRWSLGTSLGRPVATLSAGTVAGAAPEAPIAWCNSNASLELLEPIVLTPGWSLRIEQATANIALNNGEFQWSERTAQPGEI